MNPKMQDLQDHIAMKLMRIEDDLKRMGCTGISRMTLIARDPANDEMLVCVTNDDLEAACQAAMKHEEK